MTTFRLDKSRIRAIRKCQVTSAEMARQARIDALRGYRLSLNSGNELSGAGK
jgi:hypothetical protein